MAGGSTGWDAPNTVVSKKTPPKGYKKYGSYWYKTDKTIDGPSVMDDNFESKDWAKPNTETQYVGKQLAPIGLDNISSSIPKGVQRMWGGARYGVQSLIPGESPIEKIVHENETGNTLEALEKGWVQDAPDFGVNTPLGRLGTRGVAEQLLTPDNWMPGIGFVKWGGKAAAAVAVNAAKQQVKTTGKRAIESYRLAPEAGELNLGKQGENLSAKVTKPVTEAAETVAPSPTDVKKSLTTAPLEAAPSPKVADAMPPVEPPKPPTATGTVPTPPNPIPPNLKATFGKVVSIVDSLQPAMAAQKGIRHQQLQAKSARLGEVFANPKGMQTLDEAKSALTGKLANGQKLPISELTPDEVDSLFNYVATADLPVFKATSLKGNVTQLNFTRHNAMDALKGLLTTAKLPTESEARLLKEVFGEDIAKLVDIAQKKPSLWKKIINISGIPRAIQASSDISWHLRQGMLMIGSPEWWKAWKPELQSFAKEDIARIRSQRIVDNPKYNFARSSGLYAAPYEDVITGTTVQHEEQFMTNVFEKAFKTHGVTGAKRVAAEAGNALTYPVRGSQRAFTVAGNEVRFGEFYRQVDNWLDQGLSEAEIIEKGQRYARFLNAATGRGTWRTLEKTGDLPAVLNFAFFAPRFLVSRAQYPFLAADVLFKDPTLRSKVAKQLVASIGTGTAILTLAAMAGAKVERDPRSTDFGKIKVGGTRYDFWGGYQQLARYTTNFITGQKKVASGQVKEQGRMDTLGRFAQSKLNTAPSMLMDWLRGKNFIGEPMEATDEVAKREFWNRLTPMFAQNIADAIAQDGVKGAAMALPAGLGAGVQSYADPYNAWMSKYPETIRLKTPYGAVSDKLTVSAGQSIKLSDQEKSTLQGVTNEYAEKNVKQMLLSANYIRGNDEVRAKLLSKALDDARERARRTMNAIMPASVKQQRILEQQAEESRKVGQTNPAAEKRAIYQNPQILDVRKQQALAILASTTS
ncbi:MAG: hypothetical protein WC455_15515 [Dehalococcoidia bacterium]|jgi:hypothetical protein